jgi:hypothetical protein
MRRGDVNIAYTVVGEGPYDLVYVPGAVSNVELLSRSYAPSDGLVRS